MRRYIYFYRSIGEEKCRKCPGSLGVGTCGDADGGGGGGGAADAFGDGASDVRLSKKTEGARRLIYVATAKTLGAFSRSSYKIYDGKYKWRLSML